MDENKQAEQIEVNEIASANDALVSDRAGAETSVNAPISNLSESIFNKLDNIGKARFDIDVASREIEKAKNQIAAANEAIAVEKIECRRELFSLMEYKAAEIYDRAKQNSEKKSQSAIAKAIEYDLKKQFKELATEATEVTLLAKLIIKSQIQEWGDREWDLLVEKTSKWESKIILSLFTKVTKKELFFDALKKFAGSIPSSEDISKYKNEFAPTKIYDTAKWTSATNDLILKKCKQITPEIVNDCAEKVKLELVQKSSDRGIEIDPENIEVPASDVAKKIAEVDNKVLELFPKQKSKKRRNNSELEGLQAELKHQERINESLKIKLQKTMAEKKALENSIQEKIDRSLTDKLGGLVDILVNVGAVGKDKKDLILNGLDQLIKAETEKENTNTEETNKVA